MSTTSIGREAESNVAEHLKKLGYKLVDQNWRTKFCEIDLIMSKDDTVYFIEVKYRSSSKYGSGLEYITPQKLRQMRFAAEMWLSSGKWAGDVQLCAVEVGSNQGTIELVELV